MGKVKKIAVDALYKTTDYRIFKPLIKNRDINDKLVKRLKVLMKDEGYVKGLPIVVDSNFVIKDGHHRWFAAKELAKSTGQKVPLYYIVDDNFNDSFLIPCNEVRRKWSMEDCLDYYIQHGTPEQKANYKKFGSIWNKYSDPGQDKPWLNVGVLMVLLSTHSSTGATAQRDGRLRERFRLGELELVDGESIKRVSEILTKLEDFHKIGLPFGTPPRFQAAAVKLFTEFINYDHKKMMTRLSGYHSIHSRIHKCPTEDEYIDMLREVYNYQRTPRHRITSSKVINR